MIKQSLAMAIALAGVTTHVSATDHRNEPVNLETVTVTGTLVETSIRDVAGSISAISSDQIDTQLVTNIADLIRYEPGVFAQGQGRFGLSGFAVRGLGDDRVSILIDGIPVADEFSFGPFLSSGRNAIDIDSVKRVEILKGPASALYGSDAIAGVVQFFSKQPMDYVRSGEMGDIKLGYGSASNLYLANGTVATGNDTIAALLSTKFQRADEQQTAGDIGGAGDPITGVNRRTEANPQDAHRQNLLTSVQWLPSESLEVVFTADYFQEDGSTEVASAAGTLSRGTLIEREAADDEQQRLRLSTQLDFRFPSGLADVLNARIYWQQSETDQSTFQQRFGAVGRQNPAPVAQNRTRDSHYEQDVWGARFVFGKELQLGSLTHDLQYGFDYERRDSETLREGRTWLRESGQTLPEFSVFPARDFPISETTEAAVFISDVISFGNSGWKLLPGLRYDSFEHKPTTDTFYLNSSGAQQAENYDDSNLSVKLGLSKQVNKHLNAYVQYAEGFRVPAFDDVNVGFTNFAGGYTTLANPDLDPEQSQSLEFGLKGNLGDAEFEVAVFNNRFTDFIDSLAARGFNPMTQLLEFQAQNIDDVTIRGIEAKLTASLAEKLTLNAALAINDSEDKATGEEVATVAPAKLVLGIDWQATDRVSLSGVATHSSQKDGLANSDPRAPSAADFWIRLRIRLLI